MNHLLLQLLAGISVLITTVLNSEMHPRSVSAQIRVSLFPRTKCAYYKLSVAVSGHCETGISTDMGVGYKELFKYEPALLARLLIDADSDIWLKKDFRQKALAVHKNTKSIVYV